MVEIARLPGVQVAVILVATAIIWKIVDMLVTRFFDIDSPSKIAELSRSVDSLTKSVNKNIEGQRACRESLSERFATINNVEKCFDYIGGLDRRIAYLEGKKNGC